MSIGITSLIDLSDDLKKNLSETSTVLSDKNEDDLCEIFFDGNEDIKTRVQALELLWEKNNDVCTESVNKVSSMFMFTPTSIFRQLLKYIVLNSNININIKNECARAIYDDNKNSGYECFDCIAQNMSSFPTPLQLDIIKILMETELYYNRTIKILVGIITNPNLECEYRYKSLLGIQRDTTKKYIPKYLNEAYFEFIKNDRTYTRYRIIASQYILQHKTISSDIKNEVEKLCISFASDNQLDYNLRADAADLLVRAGSDQAKEIGRDIIILLGRNTGGLTTIYNDRQNVHDEKIDENIKKFILELSSIHLKNNSEGKYITFSDVQKEIEEIVSSKRFDNIASIDEKMDKATGKTIKSSIDKVRSSLLRISIDQTIYDGGQTLQSLFNKVWQLINEHEYKDVLRDRMVEELIDMADTCASGHISRIINVLSGFEIEGKTIGFDIGWGKQIQSNLIARLNSRIKDIKDEDKQFKILDEMITSGNISSKPTLALFFRDNLLQIREEMFKEFVDEGYIKDDEFEEYFRSAITFFEEGN